MSNIYEKEDIKIVYNKNIERVFTDPNLSIHIFGTGSEGNSIFFKDLNILIDLGLPYKRYQDYDENFMSYVDYIFLTHNHGDHYIESTMKKVLNNFPHVNFLINSHMLRLINEKNILNKFLPRFRIIDIENIHPFELKTRNDELIVDPKTVKHGDIVNSAWVFKSEKNKRKYLYTTDLDNLRGKSTFTDCFGEFTHVTGLPEDEKFDIIFLEANYNEEVLNAWLSVHTSPEDKIRANGNLRHISEKEAFTFVRKHLTDDGIFIPIHASRKFGTLLQI